MRGVRIPALGKLITDSWITAEQALRENIRKKFPDQDESGVTILLCGDLREEFDRVSASGAVERAFLSDLRQTFTNIKEESLSRIARGLIATVSFHPPQVERHTGGDFGIVIVRPDVRKGRFVSSHLTIERDYKRGLLCQAKIFGRDSQWGKLTESQKRTLPEKLSYFTLLLYRYDES
jgi:hypothetical protein